MSPAARLRSTHKPIWGTAAVLWSAIDRVWTSDWHVHWSMCALHQTPVQTARETPSPEGRADQTSKQRHYFSMERLPIRLSASQRQIAAEIHRQDCLLVPAALTVPRHLRVQKAHCVCPAAQVSPSEALRRRSTPDAQ